MKSPGKRTSTARIDDVAAHAEVSTATVSRAINTPESVRPSTRERINKAIQELGYIPNAGARALMLGRSGTIGVIVPTLDNAIFARGLEEFQKHLVQKNYQVLVASSNYDIEIEERQIINLLTRGVEGMALFGRSQSKAALRILNDRSVPRIHLGTLSPPKGGYACGFDNQHAIRIGVRHLLELGHREFGILAGVTHNNDRALGRLHGAIEELRVHGIALPSPRIVESSYDIGVARKKFHDLYKNHPEITALICGMDILAIGALSQAQDQGVSIPGQLSIIGFDDLELSRHIRPALTTIRIDAKDMWVKAAEHLLQQIAGASNLSKKIASKTELIVRESTGPVRA